MPPPRSPLFKPPSSLLRLRRARMFRADTPVAASAARDQPRGQALRGAADPRWVLAMRVAESLQGMMLPPEKRERLIRTGRMLGLTAFDSNLIIAIVQDQARRGYAPSYCPAAGEEQLTMIALPQSRRRRERLWSAIVCVLLMLTIEAFCVWWLFF